MAKSIIHLCPVCCGSGEINVPSEGREISLLCASCKGTGQEVEDPPKFYRN